MGADISTKMSVTGLSQYKSAMSQAKTSVKTLDAELKRVEAQYKATGDKEQYMAEKTKLLETRMQTQRKIAKEAENALKQMRSNGVDPLNNQYQRMQQQLSAAQTAMLETSAELSKLTQEEQKASAGADQLTASVGGISKKVSLDAVIGGIDKFTGVLEKAAKKAYDLGRAIASSIGESASWADDTATAATVLGMDVEEYQRYQGVFSTAADITVADWKKAKQKVQTLLYTPTSEQIDILRALGVSPNKLVDTGGGILEPVVKDYEEMFWQLGEKLRDKVASGEMTQDMADVYANALFGKGFSNLNPIFKMGQEEFEKELSEQKVVSEESINKLAELNDQLVKTRDDFEKLKSEVTAGLAPALQKAAEVLDSLLGKLMDYLQTEDGQKMLEDLGVAVEGLFEDLGKIDPEAVVAGFVDVFDKVVGSFQWLVQNKSTVEGLLGGIVTAWGVAKLTGGALQVLQLVNGINGLRGGAAAAVVSDAVSGALTAGGGGFAATFAKALTSTPLTVALAAVTLTPIIDAIVKGKTPEQAAADAAIEEVKEATPGVNAFTAASGDQAKKVTHLMGGALWEAFTGQKVEVPTEPKVEDDAAESIREQVGQVSIPVTLVPTVSQPGGFPGGAGAAGGVFMYDKNVLPTGHVHVNGIPFVPFDGYIASLHRGERVMPARDNKSYTYNSNTYFGNVNLNNGMEIEALSESIARQNRKTQRGFGS